MVDVKQGTLLRWKYNDTLTCIVNSVGADKIVDEGYMDKGNFR
jgi:hypothetical protein